MSVPTDIAWESTLNYCKRNSPTVVIATKLADTHKDILERASLRVDIGTKASLPDNFVSAIRDIIKEGVEILYVGNPDVLPKDIRGNITRILPIT